MDRATALRLFDFSTMVVIAHDIRHSRVTGTAEEMVGLIEEATINPVMREQLAQFLGVVS